MRKIKITTLFPDIMSGSYNIVGNTDIFVSGITHDSRQVKKDFVFCAIKLNTKENNLWYSIKQSVDSNFYFNHESYIEDAILNGASVIITENISQDILSKYPDITIIYVENVIKFIGSQVSVLSTKLNDHVIAVTGSAGKTTCVKILESVLGEVFEDKNVLRIYKYRLTPVTLPLAYYELLFYDVREEEGRIIILEMATDFFGSIATLCSILRPDFSIVLNIEDAHINVFGSQENIAKAKSEIVFGTKNGGNVFLNGKDNYVLGMRDINANVRSIIYGTIDTIYIKAHSYSPNLDYINLVLCVNSKEYFFKSTFISQSMDTVFSAVSSVACYMKGKTDDNFLNLLVCSLAKVLPLEGRMSLYNFKLKDSDITIYDNSAKMNSSNLQKLIYQVIKIPFSQNYFKVLVLFSFKSNDHKDPDVDFWKCTMSFFDKVIFIDHNSYIDKKIEILTDIYKIIPSILSSNREKIFIVVAGRSTSLASSFVKHCKSLSTNEKKLVIIAHSWSSSVSDWDGIKYILENNNYRVKVVSFPGLDDNTHKNIMKKSVWGVPEYSEYLKNIIEELKINATFQEIIFIGHSFGGRLGIYLASHYDNFFTKLILTSSAGIRPKITFKIKAYSYFSSLLKKYIIPLKWQEIVSFKFRKYFTYTGYSKLDNIMKQVFQKVVNYDSKMEVVKINTSTLLIWGKEDKVTPIWMADYLHKNIKNSSIKVIENGGHNIYKTHQKDWLEKSELL